MATAEVLKAELETYQLGKDDLVRQAEGKFVIVIAGTWDTYEEALRSGYEQFRLDPFLVKKVEAVEQVHSIMRIG